MEYVDVELGDVNVVRVAAKRLLQTLIATKDVNPNKLYPSIYMAPNNLRDLSPCSFQPRVVSIGPLHRNDANLQRFEEEKVFFVNHLMCRPEMPSAKQTIRKCMKKVVSKIDNIRGCYREMEPYDDIELATMMVMDACFILEFIYLMPENSEYLKWEHQNIPYDLVLLENQIPFFVLKDIYGCVTCYFKHDLSLAEFIHPLMEYINLFQRSIEVPTSNSSSNLNCDHLLGYLYILYRPRGNILSSFPRSTIHSALELEKAGVNFKPNQHAEWPMAMEVKLLRNWSSTFWNLFKPTLRMPILRIHVFTELVLRNLIAYEQSNAVYPYVTSYARAMDMLIDTHEDVAKLVASKVIVNHIGSNEEAANMINRICKEVAPKHFYYTPQWEQLDRHFNGYWPKKIVKLKQTYFNSPWSIIALIAGIVLLSLLWFKPSLLSSLHEAISMKTKSLVRLLYKMISFNISM